MKTFKNNQGYRIPLWYKYRELLDPHIESVLYLHKEALVQLNEYSNPKKLSRKMYEFCDAIKFSYIKKNL